MLYYGGSTTGYNGVPAYADPLSPQFDSNVKPLLYYTDFYGFNTFNLPAVWLYGSNILMTSVHPEADGSTCADCPSTGTIPPAVSTRNWQWLCKYLNDITKSQFNCPTTSAPVFNTTAPHRAYPKLPCYSSGSNILFCDDFSIAKGTVYPGLAMQWQRNMTTWNKAQPWNATFTSTMLGKNVFPSGQAGSTDGYAVAIPQATTGSAPSQLFSKSVSLSGVSTLTVSLYYQGKTLSGGLFSLFYSLDNGISWVSLYSSALNPGVSAWTALNSPSISVVGKSSIRLLQSCNAGSANTNFCAVDGVRIIKTS